MYSHNFLLPFSITLALSSWGNWGCCLQILLLLTNFIPSSKFASHSLSIPSCNWLCHLAVCSPFESMDEGKLKDKSEFRDRTSFFSYSLHNFCPGPAIFSTLLGPLLCRALLGHFHWTRLATLNHVITLFVTIVRCSLGISGTGTVFGPNTALLFMYLCRIEKRIQIRIETSINFECIVLLKHSIFEGTFDPNFDPNFCADNFTVSTFLSPMKMFVCIQLWHALKFVSSRPEICKQQAENL